MPARATPLEVAARLQALSKEVPFEIWFGQLLQQRSTVEVLRAWEKTSGSEITLDEFRSEVGKLGYAGPAAAVEKFFHMMTSSEHIKVKRTHVTLAEIKENMKQCVEKALAHDREKMKVHKIKELEKKRELAIAFLEERRQRFSALYEEAVSVRDRPPSEQSVALQLGAKLEKVTTLPELQKLWDREADVRISKPEFRERVGKIIGTKLSNFTNGQKELDALYDSLDTDKSGGVEVAEMLPGLNALRLKVKEMKAKEKYTVDRLGVYKMRRDHAEMALSANLHAQQAEDELNKRKESVPLNVMIGSQINHKNVAEMMRTWDRSGDGIVSLAEFKSGLLLQGIEYEDEEIERVFYSIDEDRSGTIGTEELRIKVKQMQGMAVPYFKSMKEETARVAELKRKAQLQLQAERTRMEEEEEENKKQQEEEAALRREREQLLEVEASKAEERRQHAREAALERKRAEKSAFEARVAAKRLGKLKGGVFHSPRAVPGEVVTTSRRPSSASSSHLSSRPSTAGALSSRPRERRSKSPQGGLASFPLKTGLEQFQQDAVQSKPSRPRQWNQVASSKPLLIRSLPALDSEILGDLPPGAVVQVLDERVLEDGTHRVRTQKGWVTAVSKDSNYYLSDVVRPDFHTVWPTALLSGGTGRRMSSPPHRASTAR
ncbi:hypothetical protein AB1Y20_011654 [Prymnesium parvum]|uniref:EF-hand domain-containing protein n=1 Tax=Prymnesium parvum TaxID=97485 RepID=A0AB34IHT4_PRYPA